MIGAATDVTMHDDTLNNLTPRIVSFNRPTYVSGGTGGVDDDDVESISVGGVENRRRAIIDTMPRRIIVQRPVKTCFNVANLSAGIDVGKRTLNFTTKSPFLPPFFRSGKPWPTMRRSSPGCTGVSVVSTTSSP